MKAIFIDRDGVINKYPGDSEYVKSWEEFHFLPKVKSSLRKLSDNGFKIFIISNQAGVSKGIFSQENLDLITRNMLKELRDDNIHIDDVHYCIHRQEDNCSCRKPKTGLVTGVLEKFKKRGEGIEFKSSYFIGDTIRDIETGKNAGLKTILVFSGKEKLKNKRLWGVLPDFIAGDLSRAVDIILQK